MKFFIHKQFKQSTTNQLINKLTINRLTTVFNYNIIAG
jgi:hypothetical protein